MNRLVLFLMTLLSALSVSLAEQPLHESVSPGVVPDLLPIEVETVDGTPDGAPRWFRIQTGRGALEGTAEWSQGRLDLSVTLLGDSARLTVAPSGVHGESLGMALTFQDLGVMEYEITVESGTRLLNSTVRDCTELENRFIYLAMMEIQQNHAAAVTGRNLEPEEIGSSSVVAVYYLIQTMVQLPELLTDCREFDPLYGVCVVKPGFKECVSCCESARRVTAAIHLGCKLVSIYLQNRLLGGVCILSLEANNCSSVICAGKPGDPKPKECGEVGVCRFACPHQDRIPGMCGSAELVCCES